MRISYFFFSFATSISLTIFGRILFTGRALECVYANCLELNCNSEKHLGCYGFVPLRLLTLPNWSTPLKKTIATWSKHQLRYLGDTFDRENCDCLKDFSSAEIPPPPLNFWMGGGREGGELVPVFTGMRYENHSDMITFFTLAIYSSPSQ